MSLGHSSVVSPWTLSLCMEVDSFSQEILPEVNMSLKGHSTNSTSTSA